MKNTPNDLIPLSQAAQMIGIQPSTLRSKKNRGEFSVTSYKMGTSKQSKVYYSQADIDKYIEDNAVFQVQLS